ncbi:MAG: hypothetical protein AAF517_17530 [Planctomycetota bacterium]
MYESKSIPGRPMSGVMKAAALLALVSCCVSCSSGPSYQKQIGESGAWVSARSVSFETSDYSALAKLFADELTQTSLYESLRGDVADPKTPSIALLDFEIDLDDRATRVRTVESSIRSELQSVGIRYIDERARDALLERLELQQSDLHDPASRAKLGRLANAKYYLSGRLSDVTHQPSRDEMVREFHLFVDLLDIETTVSRFHKKLTVTKVMKK